MSRESDALDRHITGNYGEDQFPDYDDRDAICQVSNCEEESVDGVLCAAHQPPPEDRYEGNVPLSPLCMESKHRECSTTTCRCACHPWINS